MDSFCNAQTPVSGEDNNSTARSFLFELFLSNDIAKLDWIDVLPLIRLWVRWTKRLSAQWGFKSHKSWASGTLSVSLEYLPLSRTVEKNYLFSWLFFHLIRLKKSPMSRTWASRKNSISDYLQVNSFCLWKIRTEKQPHPQQLTQTNLKKSVGVAFSQLVFECKTSVTLVETNNFLLAQFLTKYIHQKLMLHCFFSLFDNSLQHSD